MIEHKLLFSAIGITFIMSSASLRGNDHEIFFCTKDIDAVQSSPGFFAGSNPYNQGTEKSMNVSTPLENDHHNAFNMLSTLDIVF